MVEPQPHAEEAHEEEQHAEEQHAEDEGAAKDEQPHAEVMDEQEIFADARMSIPESVLLTSFDLETILSTGLDIHVEADSAAALQQEQQQQEGPMPSSVEAATTAPSHATYHAQIDCYQEEEPDKQGAALGKIHYILEDEGAHSLCQDFHGFKVGGSVAASRR